LVQQFNIDALPVSIGRVAFLTTAHVLVLLITIAASNIFAADVTFNISYIAESSNPFADTLPGAGCLDCVYGDIWAENGYAYVGTDVNSGGMNVFSIANPASPQFLRNPANPTGTVTMPTYVGDQFEDVEVWDGLGYFGSDVTTGSTGTGVDIVDLSIPFDPLLLSRFNGSDCSLAGCGHNKVHTLSVAKSSDGNSYLYTTDNATDVVKITRVFDSSDLTTVNPQLVKSLDLGLGPVAPSNIASHEVQVRGNRMYVASKDNNYDTLYGRTSIYDVSDPANPVLLKTWDTGGRSHTATPTADGTKLIVAQEKSNGEVRIYDISMINSPNDPDTPVLLSTITRTSAGIDARSPHHPHLHGNLLFIPWYEAGLQVFNITDPAHPVHVGAFDTLVGNTDNYAGNWGVDLSLGLNRVFLSDRSRGLIVVNASGVLAQGDYDQNMVVNGADYTAWRNTYGNGSSGLHVGAFADGNYNNNVDAADYVLWRKNVGHTGPAGQGSSEFRIVTNIPEPTTMILFTVGASLIFLRRTLTVA
jgi:hypothetical protein